MDEEELNYCCLSLLLSRVGLEKLRLFFIGEWNSVGGFDPWTDCGQNGNDLLTKFVPLNYEKDKVKSGDTTEWDLSLFVKALLYSKPPFVPKSNKALYDGLVLLRETGNTLNHTPKRKIGSPEFRKLYSDACNALLLVGATPDEFQKVEKDVNQPCYEALSQVKQSLEEMKHSITGHSSSTSKSSDPTIPAEVIAQGPPAVQSYKRALKDGEVKVYRACVKIIGQDSAGKTCLKNSLCGLEFKPSEDSTDGVEVTLCTTINNNDSKSWLIRDNEGINIDDDIAFIMAKDIKEQEKLKKDTNGTSVFPYDEFKERQIADVKVDRTRDFVPSNPAEVCKEPAHLSESGYSAEESFENFEDPEQLPEGVKESLIKYLQEKRIDETIKEKEVTISIWDFAGQHLYYTSHPVFMTHRAVYILVYNLGKDLDAKAEPRARQGGREILLDNASNETNLDNLLSWLVSVHCICTPISDKSDKKEVERKYARPPVIIVGTHADEIPGDVSERIAQEERKIKDGIENCKFEAHVVKPYFAVDNCKSKDDKGVQALHSKIIEVLNTEPYYPETVPIRWFHFEKLLQVFIQKKKRFFMAMQELSKIAQKVCHVNETEIETMLNFFHGLGIIIKYGDTVVLDTKWLIDLFKSLITIKSYKEQDSKLQGFWKKLEKHGRLHIELINHIFRKQLNCDHPSIQCDCKAKKDILHMMEYFGLIAKVNEPEEGYCYLVPSHLNSMPEEDVKHCCRPSTSKPCPLYIRFLDGFIPHGLYFQLVCKWCAKINSKEPKLFRNAAKFVWDSHSGIIMTVVCSKSTIKVFLHSDLEDKTSVDFKAVEVKQLIEESLESLKGNRPWYGCLRYDLCARCPLCAGETNDTTDGPMFEENDCLHPISELFYCKEEMKWPEFPEVQYWYPRRPSSSSVATTVPSSEGALSMNDSNKRWLVVGIALMKHLLPTLRSFVHQEISKHYSNLKASDKIDVQVHGSHRKKDGKFKLNYKNINNNKGDETLFDYNVKSEVDLAKLYVQPFMAKFSGIDETCDISAVLGILTSASVFESGTQAAANNVRDVRNEFAHCNFKEWNDKHFQRCFQLMDDLVKTLNLADDEEKKLLTQLNEWKEKGVEFITDSSVDSDLLNLVKKDVDQLSKEIQHLKETHQENFKEATRTLEWAIEMIERRVTKLEKNEQYIKENVQHIEEDVQHIKEDVKDIKEDVQDIKGNVQDIKGNVQDINEIVQGLKNRVTNLEATRVS